MTSELFGHVKGAFTGAQQARRGLFELADGGTLFLDEIGEAPASLQAMLLRALESREIWPVGASDPRHVDLRIIAATNRDFLADAQAGAFRLDLYYRLAVCPIEIPPLRARPEDVRGLGEPMLEAAARRMNRALPRVTDRDVARARAARLARQRARAVEPDGAARHLPRGQGGEPSPISDLPRVAPPRSLRRRQGRRDWERTDGPPPSVRGAARRARAASNHVPGSDGSPIVLQVPDAGTTFDDLEREILAQVLARADGNQSRAARSLGLSESTLRSRLKRLGLKG